MCKYDPDFPSLLEIIILLTLRKVTEMIKRIINKLKINKLETSSISVSLKNPEIIIKIAKLKKKEVIKRKKKIMFSCFFNFKEKISRNL